MIPTISSGETKTSFPLRRSFTRALSFTLLLLVVGLNASAEEAADAKTLTTLLNDFLSGASSNDSSVHERFWADDLIYTSSTGRRFGKADILRELRSETAPKPDEPQTLYTAEDIRIQQYGETAIVAFRLVATTKKGEQQEIDQYLNSGTFLKRAGRWQVVNWQATRIPPEEKAAETAQ